MGAERTEIPLKKRVLVGHLRNLKKQQKPGQCPVEFMGAERTEIPLKEKELVGHLRNLKKQQKPGQCPVGFMGAERTEIPLKKRELVGHLRNFKTAKARPVPSGIYGSGADRNSTEEEGTGRAFAEL